MIEQNVIPFEIRRNGKEYVFWDELIEGKGEEIRTDDIKFICKMVRLKTYFS